jgi:hypothetical protein
VEAVATAGFSGECTTSISVQEKIAAIGSGADSGGKTHNGTPTWVRLSTMARARKDEASHRQAGQDDDQPHERREWGDTLTTGGDESRSGVGVV